MDKEGLKRAHHKSIVIVAFAAPSVLYGSMFFKQFVFNKATSEIFFVKLK